MGKLRCMCGAVISNVAVPNNVEGRYFNNREEEHLYGLQDHDESYEAFLDLCRDVWECEECGRLAFSYPGKSDATVKWYRPEDGKPGHLANPEKKEGS